MTFAKQNWTRRQFIQRAALAAGALSLPARSWAQVPGANNDVRVAVIGLNGRGKDHINAYAKLKGVRLTALCDCDSKVLDERAAGCKAEGIEVEKFTDIRKLLASKNVDAISIATPNHWHATAAVWGMQAGKDVYVEKPVSYDIWEGQQMIAAAKRYNKMVQSGMQSRSSIGIAEAILWVRQGNLGKIKLARALCYKPRHSIGKTSGPQPVPKTVDYDLWSGPAPLTPPRRQHFHYDWHWFWNYGGGDIANQGVHQMDIARWFLGEHQVPYKTIAIGGRFGYIDDGETPNTLMSYHDYADAPLIMEVRGLPEKTGSKKMDAYKGASIGVIIECEGGYVRVPNYERAIAFDKDGKEIKRFEGAKNHFENFIDVVRNRQQRELHANITEGHRSAALCHLANISYRLGQWHAPHEIRDMIQGDRDAVATFNRMDDHLSANGVNLAETMATTGLLVKINPNSEQIIQDKPAYRLLKRVPRKGYVIKVA